MYDRPPGTDISNRLQRRFACQSQAHPKYRDLTISWRKEGKTNSHPPPNKVALGVHTQTQTNIKTCTAPKISTLTIKTLAS